MMNEHKSQAELLDLYLEALAQNPQAPVPTGLDKKMAAFARQLMAAEAVESPARATQQRVWAKMMAAAKQPSAQAPMPYSPNGRTHSSIRPQNTEEMMNTSTYLHAPGLEGRSMETQVRRRHVNFSLAAAAVIVVVFTAGLIYAAMSPRDGKISGAVGLQSSDTPTISYQLTATAIIANETATAQAPRAVDLPSSGTPAPQQLTATAIIGNATATAEALLNSPTPTPANPTVNAFTLPSYQPALVPLEIGVSVDGALSGDEPTYFYLIQGRAGDLLTVTVNASDLVSVGYFLQYAPQIGGGDGNSGGGGGGGGGGSQGQPTSQTITIPVTEDAAIIFNVQNEAGGRAITYTIELGQVEIPLLTYGETEAGTYNPENPGFPYIYYNFVGQRGDIVDITVDSAVMDGAITLSRLGDNRFLISDDDSGAGYNPEISGFQLPADGTYRIELYPVNLEGLMEADFDITASKREPIVLVPNEHVQLSLSPKYTARVLTFEGQAGQSVELTIESSGLATLVNFLIEQSGQVLDQVVAYPSPSVSSTSPDVSVSTSAGPQRLVRQITVPADGTVTIFVNTDASSADPNMMSGGYPTFIDVFDILLTNQ